MERYFISDGRLNVYVTEWGEKDNPVIFCLHGLGSTSLSFIEVAEQLKDQFRIIAIDAPGHGKTDPFKITEEYEMPLISTWLDNIIVNLQIRQFYFLSHSWGSFVSLYYLLKYREKVLGTILIDGGYQTKRLQEESMEEEVAYYEKDFEEYAETWKQFVNAAVYGGYSHWSPSKELAAKDLVIKKDNKYYWHARGVTAGNIIKAMYKHETIDIYESLPSNILLLRATLPKEHDDYRNMTSEIFRQKTGGRVKLIPNTTHMLHRDNPKIVVEEIRSNWSHE